MANINWTPPDGWTAKTGARVQFLAPCDCSEADGLIINETQYNFLTVAGVAVNAAGGAFASGALIELVLNCDITPPVAYLVSSAGGGQGGAYVQADEPDSDTLGTLWYDTDEEDAALADIRVNLSTSFKLIPPDVTWENSKPFVPVTLNSKFLILRVIFLISLSVNLPASSPGKIPHFFIMVLPIALGRIPDKKFSHSR